MRCSINNRHGASGRAVDHTDDSGSMISDMRKEGEVEINRRAEREMIKRERG